MKKSLRIIIPFPLIFTKKIWVFLNFYYNTSSQLLILYVKIRKKKTVFYSFLFRFQIWKFSNISDINFSFGYKFVLIMVALYMEINKKMYNKILSITFLLFEKIEIEYLWSRNCHKIECKWRILKFIFPKNNFSSKKIYCVLYTIYSIFYNFFIIYSIFFSQRIISY